MSSHGSGSYLLNESNRGGLVFLPCNILVPGRYQPRKQFNQADLLLLGQSFLDGDIGIIEPIVVRAKKGEVQLYEIIAGERRWRAAQLVGMDRVPCIVRDYTDLQAWRASLIENDQRKDLNSFERAQAYQMGIEEFDLTHEGLAEMFTISREVITNHLRLFSLPQAIQLYLSNGSLSESKVRCLHGLSASDAVRIAHQAVEEGLSYRQIEALAKGCAKRKKPVAPPKQKDPDEKRFLERLSEKLGHEALLEQAKSGQPGGYLKIRYMTMEDLSSITKKILTGRD